MKVFIQVCTFPFLVEYDMGVIALRYPQIDFQVESPKKEMITFTSHKFPTPRMLSNIPTKKAMGHDDIITI